MDMSDRRWEKLAAATGIAFVVTVLVSVFLVPEQIKANDSISKIGNHFVNHRTGLLWANWIGGIAGLFFLWLAGTVAAYMRRHGAARLGAIALAGGAAGAAIGFVSCLTGGSLAWMAGHYPIGEGAVRTLWTLSELTGVVLFFPIAVFVSATSIAGMRTGTMPKWLWQTGALVGLLALVTSTTWASSGFWAPGGGMNYIGLIAFVVWILALSITLWMRIGQGEDVQAMAAERPMAMTS
jgi:hypothetical protein